MKCKISSSVHPQGHPSSLFRVSIIAVAIFVLSEVVAGSEESGTTIATTNTNTNMNASSEVGRAFKKPTHATTVAPTTKGELTTKGAAHKGTVGTTPTTAKNPATKGKHGGTLATTKKPTPEPPKKAFMVHGKIVYEVVPTTIPPPRPTAPAPQKGATCALAGEDCSKLACCSFMDTCGEYFSAPNTCGTDVDGDSY